MAAGTLKIASMGQRVLSVAEIQRRLAPVFEKYRVKRAYLFGSYARNEATPESDVDIRIEKGENDCLRGLLQESAMQLDMMDAVGREVDLLTTYPSNIYRKRFRENMERDQVMIYNDA